MEDPALPRRLGQTCRDLNEGPKQGNKHIHTPSGPRFKGMGDLKVRGGGLRVRVGLGWLREGADLSEGVIQEDRRPRQQTELCTRKG